MRSKTDLPVVFSHAEYLFWQVARREAKAAMKNMFNQYFGSAFLTNTAKESAFAYNVQRYADVYTSKLENFLDYPLESWLFAPHDVKILPHHIKVRVPNKLCSHQPRLSTDCR
jgi:hypothetical protein